MYHMQKQFYILLGRSGSGKGTQAELLKKHLEEKGVSSVVHITTGGNFREFIAGDSYTSALARNVNQQGGLQPEFLAVWNWSSIFIKLLQGNETVILDGAPRKAFEVSMLDSAIRFYGYRKPVVIYLDVPENDSMERLKKRGREDDVNEESMRAKMTWFETDVLQALDVYNKDPRYEVLHINGGKSIEEVFGEILEKLAKIA